MDADVCEANSVRSLHADGEGKEKSKFKANTLSGVYAATSLLANLALSEAKLALLEGEPLVLSDIL